MKDSQKAQQGVENRSNFQELMHEIFSRETAKWVAGVFVASAILIVSLWQMLPPEVLIFIKDSKGYRMVEIMLASAILMLLANTITTKLMSYSGSRKEKHSFVHRKPTKEAFQRETIATTNKELEKLTNSKEYIKWKESAAANRKNDDPIDKDDEITFSDED